MQVDKQEGNMPAEQGRALTITSIDNTPLTTETQILVGSLTTENIQPPQGEVMKLTLSKLPTNQPEAETPSAPPLFGTHIREGVAVVKDWLKKT